MNVEFMTDKNIDVEAKGILCYLSLYNHSTALVISEDEICEDLQISKYRLKKYINQLVENECLVVKKTEEHNDDRKLFSIVGKAYPY